MENINNLTVYNDGMRKSMEDKLFFMPIIGEDFKVLVDHGCADGTLLSFVAEKRPDMHLVGIDMNEDMLEIAKKRVPQGFFLKNTVPFYYTQQDTALNLSSVLHEVYSYSSAAEEHMFWENVHNNNYKYIIIRDMVYNDTATKLASSIDIAHLLREANPAQIKDFEDIWGDIKYQKNLIHFLLKYRYKANWSREVAENYLGYSTEDIIKNVGNKYKLIYRKDYILPFLYETVKKDFNIELNTTTHTNLIFKIVD